MGVSGRGQLSLALLGVCLLLNSSLAVIEDNQDQPTVDNETIPPREDPVKEIFPEPVTVKAPGSTEELRPNLVGLANMAIVHLPRSLTFQYVIQATREIVDGVRYELMVNAKNLNKEEIICRLVILEKPWITTEFGDKYRELRYTNCTVDESDKYDPSKYDGNTVFNSSNTEVSEGELSDLEKQIMGGKERKTTPAPDSTDANNEADISLGIIRGIESQIVPERTTTAAPNLSDGSLSLLDTLFGMNQQPVEGPTSTVATELSGNVDPTPCPNSPSSTPETVVDGIPQNPEQSQDPPSSGQTQHSEDPQISEIQTGGYLPPEEPRKPEMSDGSISLLDSIFNQPVVEPEHVVVRVTPPPPSTNPDAVLPADGVSSAAIVPNYESVEVQKSEPIAETSYAAVVPNYESVDVQKAEPIAETSYAAVVPNYESVDVQKAEPIAETAAVVPNYESVVVQKAEPIVEFDVRFQSEVQPVPVYNQAQPIPCDDDSQVTRDTETSQCALHTYSSNGQPIVGGARPIPASEYGDLETLFTSSLSGIKGGQEQVTGIDKIYCATSQVVAGTLKKINGSFRTADGKTKDCIVEIWSRPWLPGSTQLTVNCDLNEKKEESRRRRDVNGGRALFDRVNEMLPYEAVEKARGEPLFTKIISLFTYGSGNNDNNQEYLFSGLFEMADGTEKVCRLSLVQQSNRLNILNFNCHNGMDYVYSFYPSVLNIPHSKRSKEQRLFAKFMHQHKRDYAQTFAEEERFQIFTESLKKIKMLNDNEQGTAKYGITEFADMTPEEYGKRTGLRYEDYLEESNHIRNPIAEIPEDVELPRSFDWRDKGAVTQVKDQGACGSCWAFSVIGNIEGVHAVKSGQLEEYSEQELVDCDTIDSACNGGLPDQAYKAIENIGGLELESEYPYKARKEKCEFNKTMAHVRVKGAVDFPKNETAMALWLVSNGPISIGINANAMQFYRGGISHPWKLLCRKGNLDHGVLIVGFGVAEYPLFNKTLPYWVVKNSWGKRWGEQGYYRVYRGDNTCGVSEMASSAVLED